MAKDFNMNNRGCGQSGCSPLVCGWLLPKVPLSEMEFSFKVMGLREKRHLDLLLPRHVGRANAMS